MFIFCSFGSDLYAQEWRFQKETQADEGFGSILKTE